MEENLSKPEVTDSVAGGETQMPIILSFVVDRAKPNLEGLSDSSRFVGAYSLEGHESWRSPVKSTDFIERSGNPLEDFLQDILHDCMRKGRHEVGTLEMSYQVLASYLGWPETEA